MVNSAKIQNCHVDFLKTLELVKGHLDSLDLGSPRCFMEMILAKLEKLYRNVDLKNSPVSRKLLEPLRKHFKKSKIQPESKSFGVVFLGLLLDITEEKG